MTIFSSIVDRLLRKETVLTANFGAIGDTGSQFVQQTILVNPDGPEAVELIRELASALEEARIYVDDCFGRADQALSSRIDSLLLRSGKR